MASQLSGVDFGYYKEEYINMDIPLRKLKAILLYFATHTNPKFLGKTKLMKLFYFLDFDHVKKHAVPITYDTYYHLDHGPIPTVIMNMLSQAVEDPKHSPFSDIITFEKVKIRDNNMVKIKAVRQFTLKDESLFSDDELETLKIVSACYADKDQTSIEALSHSQAGWKNTLPGQVIGYQHAADDPDCQVTKEEISLGITLGK